MTGSVPLDWQVHSTYFVVAHIHCKSLPAPSYSFLLAGVCLLTPKMFGRMLSERFGWPGSLTFAGFTWRSSQCTSSGCSACRVRSHLRGRSRLGPRQLETVGGLSSQFRSWSSSIFRRWIAGPVAPDNPGTRTALVTGCQFSLPDYNL